MPRVGIPCHFSSERVDDEDEQHQRRDVWEPAPDRLPRQALLGDLGLHHLVDELAEGVPPALGLPLHQHDPEHDRHDRAEQEVGHCLRDREVQRAQVDRDPGVLLELLLRMELALSERVGGEREGEERGCEEGAPHRAPPK
jgi:hypothetical protein